ncbi:MAG: hypothetical protein WB678_03080 [Stellaceae bacterium]
MSHLPVVLPGGSAQGLFGWAKIAASMRAVIRTLPKRRRPPRDLPIPIRAAAGQLGKPIFDRGSHRIEDRDTGRRIDMGADNFLELHGE